MLREGGYGVWLPGQCNLKAKLSTCMRFWRDSPFEVVVLQLSRAGVNHKILNPKQALNPEPYTPTPDSLKSYWYSV